MLLSFETSCLFSHIATKLTTDTFLISVLTPAGAAKNNRVVAVSLYPLLKESFKLCNDITEIMGVLIDRFMQLEIPDMVQVHEIFCRISKQFDELHVFYEWCQTMGIARSSEHPDVEKISRKKLDTMDEYIHEKAALLHGNRPLSFEPKAPEPAEETKEAEPEPEPDMNKIKALPPPEKFIEEPVKKEQERLKAEEKKTPEEVGNLLDIGNVTPNNEEHGDKFALALFDGATAKTSEVSVTPWEAFKDSSGDWETALVQSASHLPNQKASLPKGLDPLMLNGMYTQGMTTASSGFVTTGSASSVAFVSAGRPEVLALPAPPVAHIGTGTVSVNADPFAASLGIAPPTYVQMSEMEKKQRLLVQEQMMWQQYIRDGMQGHAVFAGVQQQNPYQYSTGGFTRTF